VERVSEKEEGYHTELHQLDTKFDPHLGSLTRNRLK